MKICIPTNGKKGMSETVGQHFGRVPTYTILDTETKAVEIIDNNTIHMGGVGYAPELISSAGADVMICGGLGRRAIGLFEEKGINVFVGASGTVMEAVEMYDQGKLSQATDETACSEHAFRGEGTGDGHHHHH